MSNEKTLYKDCQNIISDNNLKDEDGTSKDVSSNSVEGSSSRNNLKASSPLEKSLHNHFLKYDPAIINNLMDKDTGSYIN